MSLNWKRPTMGVFVTLMTVVCTYVAAACMPAAAVAAGGASAHAASLFAHPLVVGGSPAEGEELAAESAALRSAPAAVAARVSSETAYAGLSSSAAAGLLRERLPGVVERSDGGVPVLPPGERVGRYLSSHAAQIVLPAPAGGGPSSHAVLESSAPIAVEAGKGRLAPIDLALSEVGGSFAPVRSGLAVHLPKSLSGGLSLPGTGVSLIPLSRGASSAATASPGVLDGRAVFWGGSSMGSNVDVLAKPTVSGFDLLLSLRSQDSPESFAFRVGLPGGASLVQSHGDSIAVREAGRVVARIAPPHGLDAAGTPVAASMSLSGDVVTVSVPHPAGAYEYPIVVDPEFSELVEPESLGQGLGGWHAVSTGGGFAFSSAGGELHIEHSGGYVAGDKGYYYMHTNGDSKVYEVVADISTAGGGGPVLAWDGVGEPTETMAQSAASWSSGAFTACGEASCGPAGGSEGDASAVEVGTQGSGSEAFSLTASSVSTYISQPKETHTTVRFPGAPDYYINGVRNVLSTTNWSEEWFGPKHGAFEFEAHDAGLGVSEAGWEVQYPNGTWSARRLVDYLTEGEGACTGIECSATEVRSFTYGSFYGNWPEGAVHFRVDAHDALPGTASTEHGEGETTLLVDAKAPHEVVVTGLPSEENKETKEQEFRLGEVPATVRVSATDGELGSGVESSGVKTLELAVDGHEIGKPVGSCEPGPCTASGEWVINGSELGAGYHTLEVLATDYAGNKKLKEYPFVVYAASPEALGPGSVNPESGDFALEASDVSMSGGTGGLAVGRHYDSLNTTEGRGGPLGPQWSLELGGSTSSLEVMPDGGVVISGGEGLSSFRKRESGGFESPPGDGNLTLVGRYREVEVEGKKVQEPTEFVLKDAREGTSTRFTKPAGAGAWVPTVSEGPVATSTTSDSYKTVTIDGKAVLEPVLEVAPHPEATCKSEESGGKLQFVLERGCRALTFNYAAATSAEGDGPEEWGDFKGDLTRVYFHSWDPATKAMKTVLVAHYLYDVQGRLRAEWNPSVAKEGQEEGACAKHPAASGCLAVIYGYDGEGHVTSISPPGQQPWLVRYGTTAEDGRTGRVLSVSRPKSGVKVGAGSVPSSTVRPTLSTSEPKVGYPVSVSTGSWSGEPGLFSYQWESCRYTGYCKPILGAVNSSYTPTAANKGEILDVRVRAGNAAGTDSARVSPVHTAPSEVALTPSGDVWVTESKGRVREYSPKNEVLATVNTSTSGWFTAQGPAGGECPTGIALAGNGDLWLSNGPEGHVGEFTPKGKLVKELNVQAGCAPALAAAGSTGVWVVVKGESVEEFSLEGWPAEFPEELREELWEQSPVISSSTIYGATEYDKAEVTGVAVGAEGRVWVVDRANDRLDELEDVNGRLEVVKSVKPSGVGPQQLTVGPSGNLWVDLGREVQELTSSGERLASVYAESKNTANPYLSGLAFGPEGDLWAAEPEQNRVQHLTQSSEYLGQVGPGLGQAAPSPVGEGELAEYVSQIGTETAPGGVAVTASGDVWVVESADDRLRELSPSGEVIRTVGSAGTGPGQFKWPLGVAVDGEGDLWVSDFGNGRVVELSAAGAFIRNVSVEEPWGVAVDGGDVWVSQFLVGKLAELTVAGETIRSVGGAGSGDGQFSVPMGLASGPDGELWVADQGNNRVQKLSSAGGYEAQYAVSQPKGVAVGAGGVLWVANGSALQALSSAGETLGSVGSEGTGNGQFNEAEAIAGGPGGTLWVSDAGNKRLQELQQPGSGGAPPAPSEPDSLTSTVEYGVPVSGKGAPYALGEAEVAAWGQKDDPVYATAIFPPQEPQGWPASSYTRASVDYMDSHARTVNAAGPGGGIATSEYNEEDEVVRALSAGNRAKALAAGAASAAVSEKLDTRSVYGAEGGQLQETRGPEHQVRLKDGETIMARNKVRYSYDEGAPERQQYGLVTKTTDGAEAAGKEYDVRETITSYSGQNDLGWKLRRPTSTTTDPNGQALTHTTIYDPSNGSVLETRSPGAGPAEATTAKRLASFGGTEGGGLLSEPMGVAVNKTSGDAYVADTGDSRIVELSPSGKYIRSFGSEGKGDGRLMHPEGVAVDAKGDVWVADTGNNRIEEFTGSGEYVQQIARFGRVTKAFEECVAGGATVAECEKTVTPRVEEAPIAEGTIEEPVAIATYGQEELYVLEDSREEVLVGTETAKLDATIRMPERGEDRLEKPTAVAVAGQGRVWVAGTGEYGVQKLPDAGEEVERLKTFGTVRGLTVDSEGNLWILGDGTGGGELVELGGNKLGVLREGFLAAENEESSGDVIELTVGGNLESGKGEEGYEAEQYRAPSGIAVAPEGDLWVADTGNNRVQDSVDGILGLAQFPAKGSAAKPLKFVAPTGAAVDGNGNLFTVDTGNDRVQESTGEGSFIRAIGSQGKGNGQLDHPEGVAADGKGNVWVADTANNRIQEFNGEGVYQAQFGKKGTGDGEFDEPAGLAVSGENVYVADRGNKRIQELTIKGEFVRSFGTEGEDKLVEPQAVAIDGEGHVWVTDRGADRVLEYSAEGKLITAWGQEGTGNGEFVEPDGIQVTQGGNVWVSDAGDGRVQELTADGTFLQGLGNTKPLEEPVGLALDRSTGRLAVVERHSGMIEVWQPASNGHEASGSGGVHGAVSVYYTAGEDTAHPECGGHIEWVGLPCESMPAAQPETEGLPNLPVTRIEYNIYDQAERTTETFGEKARTQTTSFDEAGRPLSATLTGSIGRAVPKISDVYSPSTGALVEQVSEAANGETHAVKESFNDLGQATSYTDAGGNTTSYTYNQFGQPTEVNYDVGAQDGMEAWQHYTYNETTGQLEEINDSAAGTFKASYGVEGEVTSESWPNGMTETFGYNSIGEAVSQAYVKQECSSKCTWFQESIAPSVHGETLYQQSTLADTSYGYNAVGRLTEVKEAPVGKGCEVRRYGYDIEGNRVSQSASAPAGGTETFPQAGGGSWEAKACASESEGASTQSHAYDQANRLIDPGVVYDGFGDITKLPAADAGGHAIESEFFVDGQLQSQTQAGVKNEYTLDPEGRTLLASSWKEDETTHEYEATGEVLNHYAGSGGTPSWTYDESSGRWTRQIAAFDGMAAVQESGGEPVLQLTDLEGNGVETAPLSSSATEPSTKERSTEFGVPTSSKPTQKYNWLGGSGLSATVSSTGTIAKDGSTYVPQLGQSLQTTSTAPPIPINKATPFVSTTVPWMAGAAASAAASETTSYQAALAKIQDAGDPPGDVPYSGSAAASKKVKCTVQVYVGEKGGWVWAHAYFGCGGSSPKGGRLSACLQYVDPYEDAASSRAYCGKVAGAWKDPEQLYAHYHQQCVAGIHYRGWAHWWIPAYGAPVKKWRWATEAEKRVWHPGEPVHRGWSCGDETMLEATAVLFLELTELALDTGGQIRELRNG